MRVCHTLFVSVHHFSSIALKQKKEIITKYFSDYSELSTDDDSPLWNRALLSAYAPGSTMKPAIAIAGLTENKINSTKTYDCTRYYTCEDQTFQCLSQHGDITVTSALEKSCNIFSPISN